MSRINLTFLNSASSKIREYIVSTDIRVLVTVPPLLGFGGFFLILLIVEQLTNGRTPQSFFEVGLGTACLIECIAGVSMVIKQEMPGPFGYVITGKLALVSGMIIIVLFGLIGLTAIGYGVFHR